MTDNRPWLVVLAGGAARRMGGDKALRPFRGATLIAATVARLRPQVAEIAVNARPGELEGLGLPLIHDAPEFAGLGPLSGVRSALVFARERDLERIITAPCDMPFLPQDMVATLMAETADVVAFDGAPLCAAWRTDLLPDLDEALSRCGGGLAVRRFQDRHKTLRLGVDNPAAFAGINTSKELEARHE